jgi:hypothetical protein
MRIDARSAACGALTMNTNHVLWLQAYIIGVLVFLISITAITEHPELVQLDWETNGRRRRYPYI